MTRESVEHERLLGIAGSGAIACGLAAVAAARGEVLLWARSDASADRAEAKLGDCGARVVTDLDALAEATFVVEAIAEDHDAKARLLADLGGRAAPDTVLATTTSSLSVAALAQASGRPDRFAALHVFNPVKRMELVELVFPEAASERTRARAHALCGALGKTAVEVPDTPGFVVNRLLFPYLFEAVRLIERTQMKPSDVDRCMTLGAGHPMGPLALLDLVGLDVSATIADEIGVPVPDSVRTLIAEGGLGRKAGRGFYEY
ncbi:MAG: 3-hydroxyacyl-CoA dehydrogenase family protein [Actinomycetota bacterium]|nr:3-hydroxyacyl-CoA dehydrogenase family protein [Actinomycetota bacterium]